MSKKLRFLEIVVIARHARFSLAKNFLQSYQGILANFKAYSRYCLNFFGYKFIIYQSFYLGKIMGYEVIDLAYTLLDDFPNFCQNLSSSSKRVYIFDKVITLFICHFPISFIYLQDIFSSFFIVFNFMFTKT